MKQTAAFLFLILLSQNSLATTCDFYFGENEISVDNVTVLEQVKVDFAKATDIPKTEFKVLVTLTRVGEFNDHQSARLYVLRSSNEIVSSSSFVVPRLPQHFTIGGSSESLEKVGTIYGVNCRRESLSQ